MDVSLYRWKGRQDQELISPYQPFRSSQSSNPAGWIVQWIRSTYDMRARDVYRCDRRFYLEAIEESALYIRYHETCIEWYCRHHCRLVTGLADWSTDPGTTVPPLPPPTGAAAKHRLRKPPRNELLSEVYTFWKCSFLLYVMPQFCW